MQQSTEDDFNDGAGQRCNIPGKRKRTILQRIIYESEGILLCTILLDEIRVIERERERERDGERKKSERRKRGRGERDGEKRIGGGREEKNSKSSFV